MLMEYFIVLLYHLFLYMYKSLSTYTKIELAVILLQGNVANDNFPIQDILSILFIFNPI
jgi:hypothetical protein